ncbi:MAG TPA: class II aldolase/adducin family protein [Gemmatimonadaceae bacterium]|nr:class II aldolase/adducin family protein [Gemmatimonadaceae bacterium]
MAGTSAIRREVVVVCRRLWERGLIAGPDGNVSVRLAPDRILVTPAGMSKVDVRPEDLVEVSSDGRHRRGTRRASSELAVHLRIYAQRPDVGAVVHAHPPVATGFSVAGEGFASCILPEVIFQVGWVPLVPYEMPGTEALARQFDPFIPTHDAFLMANHGAVTIGATLSIAHQRMESLEHTARIVLTARQLGRVNELSTEQVAALVAARERAGFSGPYPGCPAPEDQRRHE